MEIESSHPMSCRLAKNPFLLSLAMIFGILCGWNGQATDNAAQPGPLRSTKLSKACRGDIEKHCSDISQEQGRIAACLEHFRSTLSPTCSAAWSSAQRAWDHALRQGHRACENDIKSFCTPSENLDRCLSASSASLSNACRKYRDKHQADG